MTWSLDARIPVTMVTDDVGLRAELAAGAATAVLVAAPPPEHMPEGAVALVSFDCWMSHTATCTCCSGRSSAALALDRLFHARVRGDAPWFSRVVAVADTDETRELVEAALNGDRVVLARFRAA